MITQIKNRSNSESFRSQNSRLDKQNSGPSWISRKMRIIQLELDNLTKINEAPRSPESFWGQNLMVDQWNQTPSWI